MLVPVAGQVCGGWGHIKEEVLSQSWSLAASFEASAGSAPSEAPSWAVMAAFRLSSPALPAVCPSGSPLLIGTADRPG